LFDHPGSQSIHLLIDGVFNLGQRRLRMGRSPLRHGGKDFLTLCFPTLLQVFGLHLGFLSLTLGMTPFLFASVPSLGPSLPPISSKQAAQKNEPHPAWGADSPPAGSRRFIPRLESRGLSSPFSVRKFHF
jgi:hypothetical protein